MEQEKSHLENKEKDDMRSKFWFSCCEPCIRTKYSGKILRTLVVIFNILLWFAGCAVLSISVWLLVVDHGPLSYYTTFETLNTALYILLVVSILILVVSFAGTCGANLKNILIMILSIAGILLILIGEIAGLIIYIQNHSWILAQADQWFSEEFIEYPIEKASRDTVDHIQAHFQCCGLNGPDDFEKRLGQFTNLTLPPASCKKEIKTSKLIRQDLFLTGCLDVINGEVNYFLYGWPVWFSVSVLLFLELGKLITTVIYLLYLVTRGRFEYDDNDSEISGLIDATDTTSLREFEDLGKILPNIGDLPRPKIYRIIRKSDAVDFGFKIMFDDVRKCHVVVFVEPESPSHFAGLCVGSYVIEINGLMADLATAEDIDYTLEMAGSEVRILAVDPITSAIYEDNQVSINLKNVEGATRGQVEYFPRLCKIMKEESGYGFNLLYLEDRKGEFIEDLTVNGAGAKAGLKIGDRILEVNGVNIEREKSREVVERIRISGNVVFLLVVDPKTDGYFRKKAVTITASLSVDYFSGKVGLNTVTTKAKKKNKRDVKPRYCRLVKRPREEFGLYVVIDNARIGQVIRWVDCGGAADRAGLRIGDRIVEVNGQNVEYEAHQRLISVIGSNKDAAHVLVVDEDYDHAYKRNKPRLCRIFKEDGAFGFCVEYHQNKEGHYVEEVEPGGPAERAGLMVGDRVIQLNGSNIERLSHHEVLNYMRACRKEAVLLVIDSKSSKHYKQLVQFKQTGMNDVDYDAISIPDEPIFIPKDVDYYSETRTHQSLSMVDSISLSETRSYSTVRSQTSLKGVSRDGSGLPRQCALQLHENEEHGFFLAVDRDRNGQVIRRIVKGGPADQAGLMEEDRIICINDERVEGMDHEEVVSRIRESGSRIVFTVIDQRSDEQSHQGRPYLFKIMKDKGGYGFYLWYDENGHYVQDITIGSPADKAGLRAGDRLIEINGVNVESDTHEDVFYRIKACINMVTLLSVDAKTYAYCKKNNIELTARTAESKFSGETGWNPGHVNAATEKKAKQNVKKIKQEIVLKKRKSTDDYGFHLAFSNSFMGEGSSGGHVVHWVKKGSIADSAGVRDGDKIIFVNGVNVEAEDHEQVIERIHVNGEKTLVLVIEFEEEKNIPHDITIAKENDSFGFYLWFDENGHYIEDVTLGSTADKSGLKIGDRLIEVNGENIESQGHDAVVSRMRDGGESVTLNVVNVRKGEIKEAVLPRTCHITKRYGSYGFSIQQDGGGLYIEFVQSSSASDKAGLNIGDRLLEINGKSVKDLSHSEAISMVIGSVNSIDLTILSSKKENEKKIPGDLSTPIYQQLLGKNEIDYVVEKREYGRNKSKEGTDLRNMEEKDERESKEVDVKPLERKTSKKVKRSSSKKKRKVSRKKSLKNLVISKYTKGKENVAFVESEKIEEEESKQPEDSEVGFLDFTLKKVEKSSAAGWRNTSRKTPDASSNTLRMNRRNDTKPIATRNPRKFHMGSTSGTLRWQFEETDSRRPGHVVTRTIDDNAILEIAEEDDDVAMTSQNFTEKSDGKMTLPNSSNGPMDDGDVVTSSVLGDDVTDNLEDLMMTNNDDIDLSPTYSQIDERKEKRKNVMAEIVI